MRQLRHFIKDTNSKNLTIIRIPGTNLYRATRRIKTGTGLTKRSSEATGTIEQWQETAKESGDTLDIYNGTE